MPLGSMESAPGPPGLVIICCSSVADAFEGLCVSAVLSLKSETSNVDPLF